MDIPKLKSDWRPVAGFLILFPISEPEKTEAGIILPESVTVKNNSGLCVYPEASEFYGNEVFFNRHDEYALIDSDTGEHLLILFFDKVILWRPAPEKKEFFQLPKPSASTIVPQLRKINHNGDS